MDFLKELAKHDINYAKALTEIPDNE